MSQQSFAPPTNTPRKQGANRSVADSKVTLLAQEIRELVQQELGNTQMVTDPGPFFEKILPVSSERVQKIFDHLKTEKYYSNKTWKSLPTGATHPTESSIYKPFVELANEINRFVEREEWLSKDQIKGKWVDCNSSSPTTLETIKSSIRPDCAFVSVKTDRKILEQWRNDEMRSKEKELKGEPSEKDLKIIRWLQMLTAVEIKKDLTIQTIEEALGQLCCYAREIFRNQADRRFVIGLTLCANLLRTYVFDRSGVLGINKGIDINKQPLKFVQALAAFSLLHFEDMGWDPTMALYYKDMQMGVRSFSFPWRKVEGKFAPQWIIEVNGTPYVTLMALSTMDAQVMSGRATLVWEVCKLSKFKTKNYEGAEILVLKQSWQQISGEAGQHPELEMTPLEQFSYETAGITEGRLKEAVYVRDRSNNIVSTSCSIRKNLAVRGEPIRGLGDMNAESTAQTKKTSKSRSHINSNPSRTASSGMTESERKRTEWLSEEVRAFVDRRLTRILMRRRGYKLMAFESLPEFLLALSNAIRFHERCYYTGILHRDVSPNNIIIRHWSQQMGEEVGDLLDFDHAKITKSRELWRVIQELKRGPKDPDNEARAIQQYLRIRDTPLSLAAVKSCLRIMDYDETASYMAVMFKRFPSRYPANNGREMELEDLGLKEPVSPRPHFKTDVGPGQLTGTPAYMSHEILAGRPVVHDAIHDMESFFWILVEYAMVYEGPGGFETEVKSDPELQKLLHEYFDSGSYVRKAALFPPAVYDKAEDRLENDLVSKIQEYFKPVENLIKEWWKILFTAFRYKAFELANIHHHMDSILMDTVQEIIQMNLPEHPYTAIERNRRERLDEAIRRAFEDQHMITEEDMEEYGLEDNTELLDIGDEEEDVFGGH